MRQQWNKELAHGPRSSFQEASMQTALTVRYVNDYKCESHLHQLGHIPSSLLVSMDREIVSMKAAGLHILQC